MFSCFTPKARRLDPPAKSPVVSPQSLTHTGSKGLVRWTPEEPEPAPGPPPVKPLDTAIPPAPRLPLGGGGPADYVQHVLTSPALRRQLTLLLKEHWRSPLGEEQISQGIRSDGYQASVQEVIKALRSWAECVEIINATVSALHQSKEFELQQQQDITFWASRYHLFVTWSADGQHPWNLLPNANAYVTLEISRGRIGEGPAVLLAGKPIPGFHFENGILKTEHPISWSTPDHKTVQVHLELSFSSFLGYAGEGCPSYFGMQCHGLLWPADALTMPQQWPNSPPLVSGKVNCATRDTALSPAAGDSLAAFSGSYAASYLGDDGKALDQPMRDITILTDQTGEVTVQCGSSKILGWDFSINNVLTWTADGTSVWLQFLVTPDGPVILGNISTTGKGLNFFAELKSQPSRILPNGSVDFALGPALASNLSYSAGILCMDTLKQAYRRWTGKGGTLVNCESDLATRFDILNRINAAAFQALTIFGDGGTPTLDIAAEATACKAQNHADAHFQACKVAADLASSNANSARKVAAYDPEDATKLASTAAWKAYEASMLAQSAEASANEAAAAGDIANTALAKAASLRAVQAYNLARRAAQSAAEAQGRASNAALLAVEQCIAKYADRKQYLKLKDIAEASDIAAKAVSAAKDAQEAWALNSPASRAAAVEAAKKAQESSQLAHKLLRAVSKA